MRKIRYFTLALTLALLLSACGVGTELTEQNSGSFQASAEAKDERIELIIAFIGTEFYHAGLDTELKNAVAGFNQSNGDYRVKLLDYTQNGAVDEASALRKLNTEIIGGTYPNMLYFSGLSPYPYIAKGLLLDMDKCIEKDDMFAPESIAAVRALRSLGGIYFLSSSFSFETLIGKYSEFGERYGWTLEEYLAFESEMGPESWVIYNTTHDSLLRHVASRYTRTAINWEASTCTFDSEDFIVMLEASRRIQDRPETAENVLIGSGASFVANGTLKTALSWPQTVYDLAKNEQDAGEKLSYIGWPTVDGRCGTDLHLGSPIGIVSRGDNIDGCWEFVKYFVMQGEVNFALPMYRPRLLTILEDAKTNKENPVQMTEEQVERFLGLLDAIENVAIYDETVMNIIMTESEDFFSARKTAEEVANLIQSKVSLYLAELQ